MKMRSVCTLLLAAGAILSSSQSWALSAADCAGLSIRVEGGPPALSKECLARGFGGSGDQGSGTDEVIRVIGVDFVFVVSHAAAGHRTYLYRLGVKDAIQIYRIFRMTDAWGEERKSSGFAVRRFDGKLGDSDDLVACFGFTRFSGHVAGSTGYRHLIRGFYCDLGGATPTDGRIDEMMGSLKFSF